MIVVIPASIVGEDSVFFMLVIPAKAGIQCIKIMEKSNIKIKNDNEKLLIPSLL
jgi:SRSO17 transposase